MGKKRAFDKNSLVRLYENGNYQKVISKLKQFTIEGMSEEEAKNFKVLSYEKLSYINFKEGSLQKALRDIEKALSIDGDDRYKLIKLYYLCYMEHFKSACEFAKEVIAAKEPTIKKEAFFLYALAKVYNNDLTIESSLIYSLPKSRKNYLLGFVELKKGNIDKALYHFNETNPRSKREKENIAAIKAIIENREFTREIHKPLYQALLKGICSSLPNTKNARTAQKEIEKNFTQYAAQKKVKKFLFLRCSIEPETLKRYTMISEEAYNKAYINILSLLIEEENYTKAFNFFMQKSNILIHFPESIYLFLNIAKSLNAVKNMKQLLSVIDRYLALHHKKLSSFQREYILSDFIRIPADEALVPVIHNKQFVHIAEKYNSLPVILEFKSFIDLNYLELESHTEVWNRFFSKYSLLKCQDVLFVFESLSMSMHMIKHNAQESEKFAKKIEVIVESFDDSKGDHKKFKETIVALLDLFSNMVLHFEYKKHQNIYCVLDETIQYYKKIFAISSMRLPSHMRELQIAVKKKQSHRKAPVKREETDWFAEAFEELFGNEEFEINDIELHIETAYLEFVEALENEGDLLSVVQECQNLLQKDEFSLYKWRNEIMTVYLDMLVAYNEEKGELSKTFLHEFIRITKMKINSENTVRMLNIFKNYKKSPLVLIEVIKYLLDMYYPKPETVWYLKWIVLYIDMTHQYSYERSQDYQNYFNYFLTIQEKHNYKTLESVYRRLRKDFGRKDTLW